MDICNSKAMDEAISRYSKSKSKLEAALSNEAGIPKTEVLRTLEQDLEDSFLNLLSTYPDGLKDVVGKSKLFFDEIKAETELPSYLAKALENIIEDLVRLIHD